MRLSEHKEIQRMLNILGVPIAELVAVERARGNEAEVALTKFKDRIASAFRAAVRSEHHPDHASDPEDEQRRAQNFRDLRAFSESVKTWTIRPVAQRRPIVIDLTSVMATMVHQFNEEIRRAAQVAAEQAMAQAAMNLQHDPPEPEPIRRRATFRSSPRGTDVESQSTRSGGRVHRVRKHRKT